MPAPYVGRFAPSPTGPLHAGSLVAALASWLDARAHGGRWLLRLEDTDTPRCLPGAGETIVDQLARCGLRADAPPWWQHTRGTAYAQALDRLRAAALVYPCTCTRREIEAALHAAGRSRARHGELVYPGTCRERAPGEDAAAGRVAAWRLRVPSGIVHWHDRRLGAQQQDVAAEVGDFVLRRADGPWAYQLAVVVDDAAQGITDVVRGEDLADNSARQTVLQHALGRPTPRYLHTPLVLGADGQKLSKQNGAAPLDLAEPLAALRQAARVLSLDLDAGDGPDDLGAWLGTATAAWARRWVA